MAARDRLASGWKEPSPGSEPSSGATSSRSSRSGDGIKINEQALAALLHSREGPVGQLVERRAQEVTAAAQRNAAVIMHRQPSVVSAIHYEMTSGTEARVGIRDEGPISEYLAAKAVREGKQGWLHRAVTGLFPG